MAIPWNPARARLSAASCVLLLAAAGLALSPAPPADPVLGALGSGLRSVLAAPLRGAFLLGLAGGLALLAGGVLLAVRAYLEGARLDWRRYLARRLWQTAVVWGVLGLAAFLARYRNSAFAPQRPVAQAPVTSAAAAAPLPAPAPPSPAGPSPEPWLFLGTALLLGAGALALLLRPAPAPPGAPQPSSVAERLASVRRRLETGDRVRDAVIACYVEMCRTFDPQGRKESLTAREFAALLRGDGVPSGAAEAALLALTALFEKARYSPEPCGESDRERALAALRTLEACHGGSGVEP